MIYVVTVPDRLKHGIGKTESEDILHCFLAQVMVYAVYLRFLKQTVQQFIEMLGTFQVMAKRLFYHYPAELLVFQQATLADLSSDVLKERRWDCHIKNTVHGFFPAFLELIYLLL